MPPVELTTIPPTPLCADPQSALVTRFDIFPEPSLPEPAPRAAFRDPVFGSCVVRVTDRTSDPVEGDNSNGMKNEYSRVQAFNADENRILVRGISGTWYLYDALTLNPLGQIPIEVDPRWSATDPISFTTSARHI